MLFTLNSAKIRLKNPLKFSFKFDKFYSTQIWAKFCTACFLLA
ncbi:hypothetical protein CAMRE0001_2747 [Campylobacter rectus RM3267]|uniref:Uncharacterized protein n=1 Tax=Campylobacter rectus RM3267 TaxID=553218 RepID=B9D0U8_CAMRE|nr:hypothetical protein CAMRE0001_2747 [Campylobacter rectus RM3267]